MNWLGGVVPSDLQDWGYVIGDEARLAEMGGWRLVYEARPQVDQRVWL